jgi:4'-phosphopantetheinyl transferase
VTHLSGHAWVRPQQHPELAASATHVWRIPLDDCADISQHLGLLTPDEQERVRRFYYPHHGKRYAVAHSTLRQLLAAYDNVDPLGLEFSVGEHGKPELVAGGAPDREPLHFNLSHSGEMALVAVARHGAVGVDVERWRTTVQHLEIAERFFSPLERDALLRLRDDADAVLRGFFSTWSRKEAYLKATGHGISRGLHHFDVTSGERAELLADRLDPEAIARWSMTHLSVRAGYSAALVFPRLRSGSPGAGSPGAGSPGAVQQFELPYI